MPWHLVNVIKDNYKLLIKFLSKVLNADTVEVSKRIIALWNYTFATNNSIHPSKLVSMASSHLAPSQQSPMELIRHFLFSFIKI